MTGEFAWRKNINNHIFPEAEEVISMDFSISYDGSDTSNLSEPVQCSFYCPYSASLRKSGGHSSGLVTLYNG